MAESEVMGTGALKQKFGELKNGMATRTSRAMVVAAGGVLKKKAKAIALANGSKRTGVMIKNIAIKREAQAPAGTAQYHLGVRNGGDLTKKQKSAGKRLAVNDRGRVVTRYADDPFYWIWVEQGHKTVSRAPQGQATSLRSRRRSAASQVAAKPFIGPALEQGRADAIEAMSARLQKELDNASAA